MKLKGGAMVDRAARVDAVIQKMGLHHARKTLVGSRLVRGCSGGEKKRVSVAAALLGEPRWCALNAAYTLRVLGCICVGGTVASAAALLVRAAYASMQHVPGRANIGPGQQNRRGSDAQPQSHERHRRHNHAHHHSPAQRRRVSPVRRPYASTSRILMLFWRGW